MKSRILLVLTLCALPVSAAVPFDLGLPPFEVLLQALPKWGDNLVEVSVAKERYAVSTNENAQRKSPQIYSSPVLIPAAWPRELKRAAIQGVFSFTVLPDGSTRDIRRLSEVHPDLERVATTYLLRLRYTPAEQDGNAVPSSAEVTLRFQTDGFFPE